MKKKTFNKTVRNWYKNFVMCYGVPKEKYESEVYYLAGFDDGAGVICDAMREAGIPVKTIMEIYAKVDPKGQSITYSVINDDWLEALQSA